MLHFSLFLMNWLNNTESVIFISVYWFGCSRGIDIYQNSMIINFYFQTLQSFNKTTFFDITEFHNLDINVTTLIIWGDNTIKYHIRKRYKLSWSVNNGSGSRKILEVGSRSSRQPRVLVINNKTCNIRFPYYFSAYGTTCFPSIINWGNLTFLAENRKIKNIVILLDLVGKHKSLPLSL